MRTDILCLAESLLSSFKERGLRLGVAESCTGGLLGGALTAIDGSSFVFEGGFLVYSNESKVRLLGVDEALLATEGAVSSLVAESMAGGILRGLPSCDVGLSITGVAGAGSEGKASGLVYIGLAFGGGVDSYCYNFVGGRDDIRYASVLEALRLLNKV